MKCANCSRYLRNPGVEIVIGGRALMFGPVCARKIQHKEPKKRMFSRVPRAKVHRVEQEELFGVVA